MLESRVATYANQKTIALEDIAFDQAEKQKIEPRGNTDSEPKSGSGFSKVENASNISSIYASNPDSEGAKRMRA